MSKTNEKDILFTPGPANCPEQVHQAMLRDIGSRSDEFIDTTSWIRKAILRAANLEDDDGFTVVPMQGSGTFSLESALLTLNRMEETILVLENGEYGQRLAKIVEQANRPTKVVSVSPLEPLSAALIEQALEEDPSIKSLAFVHCETTTGILNPAAEIAAAAKRRNLRVIVDGISSFAAIPIELKTSQIDCLVSSANKCLEGVPGFAFCIVKESCLERSGKNCSSLSLDLYAQWERLESSGQFRFTPPTHAMLACKRALELFFEEGGTEARGSRYAARQKQLIDGMERLGLSPLIEPANQSPIITAFPDVPSSWFSFEQLALLLARDGLYIYPGKLAGLDSFRIGTIGQIESADVERLLAAFEAALDTMRAAAH